MKSPLFELGPSADPVGTATLVAGALLLALGVLRPRALAAFVARQPARRFVLAVAALAALLSCGYVAYFLRGGPRIIDATSYFLEARALAEGKLAFALPEPTGAFRGRFSLLGPNGLAVVFPPGYPILLALGFRAGAPLLVGPLLAALLVGATYLAAKEFALGEEVARTAALLSALCVALRYHTADTMSHGLSALLLVGAMTLAARPSVARAALAGLLAGWLIATRPVSGAVAVTLTMALLATRCPRGQRLGSLALATVLLTPGLLLLGLHQRAATGSFWHSTQLAYYALADGPPGCFRWGFGQGVGCRFEHGDFVERRLGDGFGLFQALRLTGERLLWHAFDVVNLAPAVLLVPYVVWRERATTAVRWLGLGTALAVLAYLPFYFPGSYPGGGARLIADALPLEHVLVALAVTRLELAALAPGAMLLGFALNTVHAHLALSAREGGRPMFEPAVLERAHVTHGLVWVSTDHGFALGHDPAARDGQNGVVVARSRGDAHDFALWTALGRPDSYRYEYSLETGRAAVIRIPPPPSGGRWRWEAEAEWPPLAVGAGWAHPDFRPCLSGGEGLHLRPTGRTGAEVTFELGAPAAGEYAVRLGWLADKGASLRVSLGGSPFSVHHLGAGCEVSELGRRELGRTTRVVVASDDDGLIDYLELSRPSAK
jgi:hypothetical protein